VGKRPLYDKKGAAEYCDTTVRHIERLSRLRLSHRLPHEIDSPETGAGIIRRRKAELAECSDTSGLGQQPNHQDDRKPRDSDQSESQRQPGARELRRRGCLQRFWSQNLVDLVIKENHLVRFG
jgi:hypothetical protein